MNNTHLDQARDWANWLQSQRDLFGEKSQGARAAALTIQSLPDQWIDAEKVRELLDRWAANPFPTSDEVAVLNDVEALLTPSLQTLADMTPEEREACQWMQAISDPDSGYTDGPVVIVEVRDDRSMLMWEDGSFDTRYHQHITPLPDLPRLEWPAQEPQSEYGPNLGPITLSPPTREEEDEVRGQFEEPTLADLISPEDVPAGEPWIVECDGHEWVGIRADYDCRAWSITRMDGVDYQDIDDTEIALVSRLVPEDKP